MDYLIDNAWLAIGLWILLYISDYVLTIATARLYAGGADQRIDAHETAGPKRPDHRRTRRAARGLVELYEAWGRPERAAPYRVLAKADD